MLHTLNENYFETIDIPEKAYWLGYLYADGHISIKVPWFVICQTIDADHLEKLKQTIEYTGNIKYPKYSGNFKNSSQMGRIALCRKKLCIDLIK